MKVDRRLFLRTSAVTLGGLILGGLEMGTSNEQPIEDENVSRLLQDAQRLMRDRDLNFPFTQGIVFQDRQTGGILFSETLTYGQDNQLVYEKVGDQEKVTSESVRGVYLQGHDQFLLSDLYYRFKVVEDGTNNSRIDHLIIGIGTPGDPRSAKSIRFSWSPNSAEDMIALDKDIYVDPVDGGEFPWHIQLSSRTNFPPQNPDVRGTLLGSSLSAESRNSLLILTNSWQQLIRRDTEGQESRVDLIRDFATTSIPFVQQITP